MRCFACNAEVRLAAGERIGFRDECDGCGGDLHCCRNCTHHDPGAYNECREPSSERVSDRERGNSCDYFSPTEREGGSGDERQEALADLGSLFKKQP